MSSDSPQNKSALPDRRTVLEAGAALAISTAGLPSILPGTAAANFNNPTLIQSGILKMVNALRGLGQFMGQCGLSTNNVHQDWLFTSLMPGQAESWDEYYQQISTAGVKLKGLLTNDRPGAMALLRSDVQRLFEVGKTIIYKQREVIKSSKEVGIDVHRYIQLINTIQTAQSDAISEAIAIKQKRNDPRGIMDIIQKYTTTIPHKARHAEQALAELLGTNHQETWQGMLLEDQYGQHIMQLSVDDIKHRCVERLWQQFGALPEILQKGGMPKREAIKLIQSYKESFGELVCQEAEYFEASCNLPQQSRPYIENDDSNMRYLKGQADWVDRIRDNGPIGEDIAYIPHNHFAR